MSRNHQKEDQSRWHRWNGSSHRCPDPSLQSNPSDRQPCMPRLRANRENCMLYRWKNLCTRHSEEHSVCMCRLLPRSSWGYSFVCTAHWPDEGLLDMKGTACLCHHRSNRVHRRVRMSPAQSQNNLLDTLTSSCPGTDRAGKCLCYSSHTRLCSHRPRS